MSNILYSELLAYDDRLSAEILQEAYQDIIQKLKLNPALFPVNLTTAAHYNGFITKAETYNGSQIAIKEVRDIIGCNVSTNVSIAGSLGTLILGDISTPGYGLSNFDSLNDNHKTIPDVLWFNNILYSEETNPAFFLMDCYVYPYPLLIVDGSGPFSDVMEYDIANMVSTYGAAELYFDNVLLVFIYLKSLSIIATGTGDIGRSAHYNKICTQFITMYNLNPKWIKKNVPAVVASVKAGCL